METKDCCETDPSFKVSRWVALLLDLDYVFLVRMKQRNENVKKGFKILPPLLIADY